VRWSSEHLPDGTSISFPEAAPSIAPQTKINIIQACKVDLAE
jgi:hypothetical protein